METFRETGRICDRTDGMFAKTAEMSAKIAAIFEETAKSCGMTVNQAPGRNS